MCLTVIFFALWHQAGCIKKQAKEDKISTFSGWPSQKAVEPPSCFWVIPTYRLWYNELITAYPFAHITTCIHVHLWMYMQLHDMKCKFIMSPRSQLYSMQNSNSSYHDHRHNTTNQPRNIATQVVSIINAAVNLQQLSQLIIFKSPSSTSMSSSSSSHFKR